MRLVAGSYKESRAAQIVLNMARKSINNWLSYSTQTSATGSPRATLSTCGASSLHIPVETSKYPSRCLGDSLALRKVPFPQLPRQRLGNLIHPPQSFLLRSVGP